MPLPVAIAIAAAIIALAIWAIRIGLRNAKRKAALLSTKGFRPVQRPDPQVAEPLLQLYRRGPVRGRRLQLSNAFHRDHPGGQMYVFDVLNPGRRNPGIISNAVGVVRRGAGLPPFEVYAFAEQGEPMGDFLTPILTRALGEGKVVRFDDLPEFTRRFTVLSPEEGGEEAVRRYLTPGIREALLRFQFFRIVAEGDAFALHANYLRGPDRGDEIGGLARMIEEAGGVTRVLEPAAAPGGDAHP